MRHFAPLLLVTCILGFVAQARAVEVEDVPNPRRTHGGWVSDPHDVLGPARVQLEQRLDALHRETGFEVAVAIIDDTPGEHPKDFAVELFKYWGIGQKGIDNGVLVLQVLDRRRIEIETGYAVEGQLPDVKCAWLIEAVRPQFHDQEYARGQLALSFGIEMALRNPDIEHDALVSAVVAFADTLPSAPVASGKRVGKVLGSSSGEPGASAWIWAPLAFVLALLSRYVLRRVVRLQVGYLDQTVTAEGCATLLFYIGTFFAVLTSLAMGETTYQLIVSLLFLTIAAINGTRAWKRYRIVQARRLRACDACKRTMRAVEGEAVLPLLSEGQRAEHSAKSRYFYGWRCECGAQAVESTEGEKPLEPCTSCGFHVPRTREVEELRQATRMHHGLRKVRMHCGFCHHVQETEESVLWESPYSIVSSGSSDSSWSSSSSDSSSSSSDSSSSSSDFGGGSSGGGGAGGDY